MGRREVQGEGDICVHIGSHFVQQKLTQHCKVIILQFLKTNMAATASVLAPEVSPQHPVQSPHRFTQLIILGWPGAGLGK